MLALDFTLNLKPAANFAFTLNASLLFVVGMSTVTMAMAYKSARVYGGSTRKVSTDIDFSLLTLEVAAVLGCGGQDESSGQEACAEYEEFFHLIFSTGVVVLLDVTENAKKEFKESFLPPGFQTELHIIMND